MRHSMNPFTDKISTNTLSKGNETIENEMQVAESWWFDTKPPILKAKSQMQQLDTKTELTARIYSSWATNQITWGPNQLYRYFF